MSDYRDVCFTKNELKHIIICVDYVLNDKTIMKRDSEIIELMRFKAKVKFISENL